MNNGVEKVRLRLRPLLGLVRYGAIWGDKKWEKEYIWNYFGREASRWEFLHISGILAILWMILMQKGGGNYPQSNIVAFKLQICKNDNRISFMDWNRKQDGLFANGFESVSRAKYFLEVHLDLFYFDHGSDSIHRNQRVSKHGPVHQGAIGPGSKPADISVETKYAVYHQECWKYFRRIGF